MHCLPDEPIIRDSRQAHIWFCYLDDGLQQVDWHSLLSTDELVRVYRLKSPIQRRRFVNRFVFVRKVLGNLTGISPEKLEYYYDGNGKPQLVCPLGINGKPLARLNFNISHTENILVLAVTFGPEVGVDLEMVKIGLDFFEIAKTNFTAEYLHLLSFLQPNKVAVLFYHLWTRKEALAKMDGRAMALLSNTKLMTDLHCTLYSFELNVGEKKIIGALALGSYPTVHQNNLK